MSRSEVTRGGEGGGPQKALEELRSRYERCRKNKAVLNLLRKKALRERDQAKSELAAVKSELQRNNRMFEHIRTDLARVGELASTRNPREGTLVRKIVEQIDAHLQDA